MVKESKWRWPRNEANHHDAVVECIIMCYSILRGRIKGKKCFIFHIA